MSNLIQSYLEELEQRLEPHVSEARRNEILQELRSHLWMSRQGAISELDMPEDAADQAAVNSLGSGQVLADDLIHRESGYVSRSPWRLTAWPCAALITAHVAPWALMVAGLSPFIPLAHSLHYVTLAALATCAWRSRRWLIGPMAAGLLASILVSFATGYFLQINTPSVPEFSKGDAIKGLQSNLADYRSALAGDLEPVRVAQGFRAPQYEKATASYQLPYMPFSIPSPGPPSLSQSIVPTAAEARQAWRLHGPRYVAGLEEMLRAYTTGPNLVEMARDYAPRAAVSFSYEICVLTVVNAAALLILNRRRTRKSRKRSLA